MTEGLAISNVVDVSVTFTPQASAERDFGTMLLIGPSQVIPPAEGIRFYTSIGGVAADFGTSSPEYYAASLFFAQSPQPSRLYVGQFYGNNTQGQLLGGSYDVSQQAALLASFRAITNGSFLITVAGVLRTVTSLNFSTDTSLSLVAARINTACSAFAHVAWNATYGEFILTTNGNGPISGALTYATVGGGGTDVSSLLKWQVNQASYLSPGSDAETPLECVVRLANQSNAWYACAFALSGFDDILEDDMVAVAQFIEAASPVRIFGVSWGDPAVLVAGNTSNLAYMLKNLSLRRTFLQFSRTSNWAVFSAFAKGLSVDFTANNTTLTLKFKTEPSVIPETLTESQAAAAGAVNANVYVKYNNSTAIIQQGVMSNGLFFDEVHGTDWFANAIENAVYNLLYTSPTKIPQTDAGATQIANVIEAACAAAVNNGLLASGLWTGPNIGPIKTGQLLPSGFFVYMPPMASQSQADREARIAPTAQVMAKLAGAVHFANVLVNVNR